ncbi:MAG: hypothetical protein EBV35_00700 [Betaproteobacteria bacterium]|nr:hypothetical protein [Betaproteobacteria bacterium]
MSYFNPAPKLGPPRLLYVVTDLQRVRYSPGVPLFVSSDYAAALQVFHTHEPEMAFAYDRGEPMMNRGVASLTVVRVASLTVVRVASLTVVSTDTGGGCAAELRVG